MYIFRFAITFEINSFIKLFSSDDSFNDKCTNMKINSFVFAVACNTYPGSNDKRLFNCERIPWHWYSAKAKNRLSNIFFLFICVVWYFSIAHSPSLLACLLVCSLYLYFISGSLCLGSLSLSFSHWHTNDFFSSSFCMYLCASVMTSAPAKHLYTVLCFVVYV